MTGPVICPFPFSFRQEATCVSKSNMFSGFSKHMWLLEATSKCPPAGIQRIYSLPPAPSPTNFRLPRGKPKNLSNPKP